MTLARGARLRTARTSRKSHRDPPMFNAAQVARQES